MDIHHLHRHRPLLKTLRERLEKLKNSHRDSKANPEILSLARGVGLVGIAVILGWMGKTHTEESTRSEILTGEWPAYSIWNATLRQGGWAPIQKSDYTNLIQNITDHAGESPSIWESQDHCLIYLSHSPYGAPDSSKTDQEMWSCAIGRLPPPKKIAWRYLGSGYSGVNRLSEIRFSRPKKAASYVDPNEIRY